MTIHIVTIVSLMLGEKTMSPSGGCGPITVWGAGKCRVLSMKQTGNEQASPGTPPFGNGGNSDEGEDVDDDDGADQEEPSGGQPAARFRFGRRRRSGRLRDRVGRGLLARHAASTHRSAACRRARSVVPAASAGYSIVLRNLLTSR